MLTAVLATLAAGGDINIPVLLAKQIILGVGLGLAIGWAAGRLIERAHATAEDAQTIFLFAVAIVAYALPSYLGGNGFLAVYLAGIVLGASDITGKVETGALLRHPHRDGRDDHLLFARPARDTRTPAANAAAGPGAHGVYALCEPPHRRWRAAGTV